MKFSTLLCFDGLCYEHTFYHKQVDEKMDLLHWLEAKEEAIKLYWHSEKEEVAAVGSILSLDAAPHFNKENTSPARFWGGHAFFPHLPPKEDSWNSFPRSCFFLPKEEIRRGQEKTILVENHLSPLAPPSLKGGLPKVKSSFPSSSPSKEIWEKLTEQVLNKITQKELAKVVLARRSTFPCPPSSSPFEILSHLPAERSTLFALQFQPGITFLGASPERLFKRKKQQIFTEAVAGTRKRGQSKQEDEELGRELLSSSKERNEFSFVKQSIVQALQLLCLQWEGKQEDGLLKTSHVQHLYHPFEGWLKEGVSDCDLLAALHPTAAMGGFPKDRALEHLLLHEPIERGWYASPLGYCSQDNAEFIVGIRSALYSASTENYLHLFAGAGIVSGSYPEKEWEELDYKIALWRKE